MILQIHESIGHPLELDRILGDERNFAGTSFVTPDMFGSYRYGSTSSTSRSTRRAPRSSRATASTTRARAPRRVHPDPRRHPRAPARRRDLAAARGAARRRQRARRQLEPAADRPHGEPQPRAGRRDVRRAGRARIERGVLMETNCSWSIDDSRNKFQFGCERGALIENGKLDARGQEPQLPRHLGERSGAASPRVGNAVDDAGARHAVLRQGRAVAGDPRRARVAGVRVHRRRRVRRGSLMNARDRPQVRRRPPRSASATGSPRSSARSRRASATPPRCAGEATDFVAPQPRQGAPSRAPSRSDDLSIRLVHGARHAEHTLSMIGERRRRTARRSRRGRRTARGAAGPRRRSAPAAAATRVESTQRARTGALPPAEAVVDEVLAAADGLDLVGIYAAGPVWRGFANSEGQRNWHATTTFNLQWSLVRPRRQGGEERATRASRGTRADVRARMAQARERLALVARPSRTLAPGKLPRLPRAVGAGGDRRAPVLGRVLGARARDAAEPARADARRRALDPRVTIAEDTAGGVAPGVPGRRLRASVARAARRRRARWSAR